MQFTSGRVSLGQVGGQAGGQAGCNHRSRRNAAVRAGLFALSAAVASFSTGLAARADITNGFTNFATPNLDAGAAAAPTNIGYNLSNGTFEETNSAINEAVSGFSATPQTITSFDVSFVLTVSAGTANGGAFIIENSSSGLTDLGGSAANDGFNGSGASSIGFVYDFDGTARTGTGNNNSRDSIDQNGGKPTYTLFDTVGFQGGSGPNANYRNLPVLDSGDQVQFNFAYFGTTLTENIVDLTAHSGLTQIYSNLNIPTIVGKNTAYVGFAASTGTSATAASTQTISNFTFVSNKSYAPIALTSGSFNVKGIVPVNGSLSSITATQDNGTALGGDTWYEQGFDSAAPTTGLPASGSTFTSQADSSHVFTLQQYSNNDVALVSSTTADGPTSDTITFASQTQAYNALSFLIAAGNGPVVLNLQINYSNGHTTTTGLQLLAPDWFSGSPSAWLANGRYSGTYDSVNSGNPNLFSEDVVLPDNTDPVQSVTVSYAGGNSGTPGNTFIFAISGEAGAAGPIVTWTGAQNSTWDNVQDNFNGTSGMIVTSVNFANGDDVFFDDTTPHSLHNVNIATSGMNISGWNVNTSTGYTFSGFGLTGPGGLTLTGPGTVVLGNSNSFTGPVSVNAGLLQLNSSSAIASALINVAAGAGLNVSSGAQLTAASITLSDSGTVNYFGSTLKLASLTGNSTGILNLNGTALTIAGSAYSGIIGGTSGSVTFTGGGSFGGSISDGTSSPIAVTVNASGGTLILGNSSTFSGGTYLVNGTLEVGNNTALGTGPVVLQGGLIGASTADVNLSNNISGGSLILATGTKVLELSGTGSAFTGPITILGTSGTNSGGTLMIDSPSALGAATSITVGSGGAFEANDASGTLGTGVTVQITGAGANGSGGALRGGDNQASVWAGNVNLSGSTYIVSGASTTAPASLTLTGSISGGGPVVFTGSPSDTVAGGTVILAPSAGNTNTYTGETQLIGESNTSAGTTLLKLGANNAISQVTGLNIISGIASQSVNFDLAGYNQSIAYLSGNAQTGYAIINSSANRSILTINNGTGSITTTSSTAIQGNIAIVKSGVGTQILAGSSTYIGGTTIAAGTLTAQAPNSLGTGTVQLNTGTLGLSGPSQFSRTGFANFSVNQNAAAQANAAGSVSSDNTTLYLTNLNNGQAVSGYSKTPVPVSTSSNFTASFTWTNANAGTNNEGPYSVADGFAFNLLSSTQDTDTALGASGGGLGYSGIGNSMSVQFDTYSGYASGFGTAYNIDGAVNASDTFTSISPIVIQDENLAVTLTYNGTAKALTEALVGLDPTNNNQPDGNTFSTTYTGVDISSILGGATSAYVGFSGGTGGVSINQWINNFTFTSTASTGGAGSIPNAVIANAGISMIQVQVAAGATNASIGALTLNNDATVVLAATSSTVGPAVLSMPSLAIAGSIGSFTGKLDITSNDLDLAAGGGTTLALVTAMVKQGYSGGSWTGNGITSSSAANDTTHLTAVGVILNDSPSQPGTPLYGNNGGISSTFDGAVPSDDDILVKYTYYGDCNLDGAIDGSDYSIIDATYQNENFSNGAAANPIGGWYFGDFNYDGVVDGSDYTLMDNAFNQQGPSLGVNPTALLATQTAQISGTSVPEPASLGLFVIGAGSLLGRRRRRMRLQ